MVRARPGRTLPPRKEPVPIVQEAGWAPGPVWTGGKSHPAGIRSPDHSSVAITTELPRPSSDKTRTKWNGVWLATLHMHHIKARKSQDYHDSVIEYSVFLGYDTTVCPRRNHSARWILKKIMLRGDT